MGLTHINPATLHKSPAFSQAVLAEGGHTLYIGGQNGIRADGTLAGDTLGAQAEQAFRNILDILEAAGASQQHVAKLTIYTVKGQDIKEGYGAAQRVWGNHPTTITSLVVEGLAVPGALVEIEAVAVVDL